MRPLKSCDGEHHADEPCDTCVEDNALCDMCWEAGDPLNVNLACVPERTISVWDEYVGRSKDYVVCSDHYRAHQRRIDLELI